MRLSQIARKLNIGTETIVNYLKTQGIEINNNPNIKISSEHLTLLENTFSGSLTEKKKAEKIVIELPKKNTLPHKNPLTNTTTIEKKTPKKKNSTSLVSNVTQQKNDSETPTLQGLTMLGKLDLTESITKKKEKYASSKSTNPRKTYTKQPAEPKPPKLRSSHPRHSERKPKSKHQELVNKQPRKLKKSSYQKEKKQRLAKAQEIEKKEASKEERILRITTFITARELAGFMNIPITQLLATCMDLGIIASINQRLDPETIIIIADELGFEVKFVTTESKIEPTTIDAPEDLLPRPPVVTVMGHVDHGKTSLLDYIRKAQVAESEKGNITQHIGAYQIQTKNSKSVVFLDTPGHEAFTAMRARGVQITDIAVIVIAADDTVMPQTKEAISHAQLANTPIIIAINKIDKPGANPQKIKEQLGQLNIMVEEWGGKYQCQEISAKTGLGINELLEKILLEADMLSLKANPNKKAQGIVIEASLDKGRGYLATVMVQAGTLKKANIIVAGSYFGKIKAMFDSKGTRVEQALPSTPVQILGLNGAPSAGQSFTVVDLPQTARDEAAKNAKILRNQRLRVQGTANLDQMRKIFDKSGSTIPKLNILIKGDVDGSIEALEDALLKLTTEKINIKIIYKAVGHILESDIILASASNAIIIGFQTKTTPKARIMATEEKVPINIYNIIYDAIDYVKEQIEKLLAPVEKKETILGKAEVIKTFVIPDVGTIAGCKIVKGSIKTNHTVRIKRKNKTLYTGPIKQLQRKSKVIKEATTHSECGMSFDNFNNILVGDIIEAVENQT